MVVARAQAQRQRLGDLERRVRIHGPAVTVLVKLIVKAAGKPLGRIDAVLDVDGAVEVYVDAVPELQLGGIEDDLVLVERTENEIEPAVERRRDSQVLGELLRGTHIRRLEYFDRRAIGRFRVEEIAFGVGADRREGEVR